MIYKNKFDITGTTPQLQIIAEGLNKIKFPWETLKPRGTYFRIGWADLNNASFYMDVKNHAGPHPKPHSMDAIIGELEGRKYIMGVFYPYTGQILVDIGLTDYREEAQRTVSAEIAHLVDYFLPLTDTQRLSIMGLMLRDDSNKLNARDWWEGSNEDYGVVYYNLPGEGFMQAFTLAYSDMSFDASQFVHTITKEQAPELRQIIGIERTDYIPPKPVPVLKEYVVYGTSQIYHKATHYPAKKGRIITEASPSLGVMRPCKICKP